MLGDWNWWTWILAGAVTRLHSPANECCDDDAPGRAATVGVGLLLVFTAPAAQANGIDEQEQEVQSQTGKRHTSQQQDGLMERGAKLWEVKSRYCFLVDNNQR